MHGQQGDMHYPVAKLSSNCVDGNVSLPSEFFPSVTSMHVDFISQKPAVIIIEQNHQDVCISTADDDPSVGGCQEDIEDNSGVCFFLCRKQMRIITTPDLVTNLTVSPLANPPASMMVLFCFSWAGALAQQLIRTQMQTGQPCLLSLLGRVGSSASAFLCHLCQTWLWQHRFPGLPAQAVSGFSLELVAADDQMS